MRHWFSFLLILCASATFARAAETPGADAAAATTGAAARARAGAASDARAINVLVLSVEDMSPWLACYGDKTAPTPNIDRLARDGVRFTNVYATTPVCAPARHTLITGMYATSTGAMHMRNGSRGKSERNPSAYDEIPLYEAVPPSQVRCFPEFLRIAGYYATNNAKEDYQFRAPPTAWDESSGKAHYRNRRAGQPFFAVFNCNFTHESQAFPNAKVRADVVRPEHVKVPPYYPDTPTARVTLAQTYNNIVAMDQWVGEKLAELDKAGLRDSTVVIFYSDHGVGLPRGKRSSYDSGLRVPLIVRFPDKRGARTTNDRLISFLDFAPTMLSLCGVKPPAYMKGRAFLGKHEAEPPTYVFSTQDRIDATIDAVRSVRDERYRYVRNLMPEVPHLPYTAYRQNLAMMRDIERLRESGAAMPDQWQIVSKSKPPEEFYDTYADPHETRNLIDQEKHQLRIRDMRDALDRWTQETGDLGLIQPESTLVREHLWPPNGEQPRTAAPMPSVSGGVLTISCETEGASIGFRQRGKGADGGDRGAWQVYTGPVEANPADGYEVVAHRIGFRRSPTVEIATSR